MWVLPFAYTKYALYKKFENRIHTCHKANSLHFRTTSEGVKN